MKPWLDTGDVQVFHGDCVDVMRSLPDASVDAVVTDPPYGINFMGRAWDGAAIAEAAVSGVDHTKTRERSASMHAGSYDLSITGNTAFQVWCRSWATEALRVLKPGGHLLAFGGTRTWHRLAVAIEDAGFEIRDNVAYLHDGGLPGPLAWCYGSGFPKSLDVSKSIDKAAGAERQVIGTEHNYGASKAEDGKQAYGDYAGHWNITAPATPAAQQWQGWGTALKPAFEPIVVARKPLIGTVAENVLTHGTGALNIDGCRVGTEERTYKSSGTPGGNAVRLQGGDGRDVENARRYAEASKQLPDTTVQGRWPANVILDESQAAELDKQSGLSVSGSTSGKRPPRRAGSGWDRPCNETHDAEIQAYGDTGGASRFFYVPKANSNERPRAGEIAHPTVKPLELMTYLVRLVTPPGGTVLEPFAGSGTTLEACVVEGFNAIGIEREADYLPLIEQRLTKPIQQVLA